MDAFGGVMVDSQDELTVQSLLSLPESSAMGLTGELMAQAAFIQGPPTEITLDEDDVFQCGKCKKVFTSFQLFMFHKKKHQLPGLSLPLEDDLDRAVIEESSQVPQHPNDETHSQNDKAPPSSALHFVALEEEGFDGLPSDIGQPIMLDSDPLNFSMDQGVLNISSTQLPEGSFVTSSLTALPSVGGAIKTHEGASSDASTTTWLLTKQDNNLNLVAASYADERTLFLDEDQKCASDVGSSKCDDKVHTDLEFTSDDLLPEVPFPTNKEVFLDGSSINVQESINVDHETRVILPSGEFMLKSGMDYINGGELLARYEKVDQQVLVPEEQSNETVSVNVLQVEMSSLEASVGLSGETLDASVVEPFSNDISAQENDKKKKRPRTKKAAKPPKTVSPSSSSQKLKCAYCSKRFAKNFDLQQHQRSHTGEKPFQCVVCGRAFAQKSNVKKHMETHKVWPKSIETLPKVIVQEVAKPKILDSVTKTEEEENGDETPAAKKGPEYIIDNSYTCQFCSASHDSYFGLKTHLKTHLSQKVYWCNQQDCMKMFPDLNSFLEHTQIHTTKEARYRCHVCKLTFKTLGDLGLHQYTHSAKEKPISRGPGERYVCLKCRSRFTSPENLEHHLATASHHHSCPECQRVFACERNLRRHLLTHSTSFPFSCKDCGKSFRTETYLNMHTVMHSNEKPFVCEHCPAAFNRKDRLSRHLLNHQAVKKYKCPFYSHLNCSREFNRQDKLKLHILTHLTHANKVQQCQFCQKEFRKVAVLRKHERKCQSRTNNVATHRKRVKRKDEKSDEMTENPVVTSFSQDLGDPQSPSCLDKQLKKQTKKIPTKKDVSKTITFKVSPSKNQPRKKRSVVETSVPEADLHSSSSNENVPTIEIIVMPLSLNVRTEDMNDPIDVNGSNEAGMYRVMFPSDSSEYPVDLTTGNDTLLSRVDCERDGQMALYSATDQEVSVYSASAGMQKL